jgi:hypothetical protein
MGRAVMVRPLSDSEGPIRPRLRSFTRLLAWTRRGNRKKKKIGEKQKTDSTADFCQKPANFVLIYNLNGYSTYGLNYII